MTMFWKSSAAALVALGLWATSAPAQDHGAKVFRLGDLPQDQAAKTYRLGDLPTQTADEQDDTLLVRGHGGGGHHGGGRHYGGGRYYGGRYYGGYRGYSGYRGYGYGYGLGYGRGFGYYRPYYYSPYYYDYCPPPVYYYQPVYTYYPVASTQQAYSGIVGTYQPATPSRAVAPMSRADEERLPPAVPPQEDGTFPYNGGPSSPVPLPNVEPIPQRGAPIDPGKGRVVSLPTYSPKFAYPAYGEKVKPASTGFAQDRTVIVKDQPAQATRR
jgi:hypothetical protein